MEQAQRQNGGRVSTFPRAVSNGLISLRGLRQQIEEAEGRAETPGISGAERRRWIRYRDLLEGALDVRIELLGKTAEGHDRAICGRTGALCREYPACDPSHDELVTICALRAGRQPVPAA